ncbi:MAG: YbhB/YbcL family Raf kinase inhibitor-like protein [Hamadaea sp.]|nr:YbhB/YbcL family Raf kinase inhibitor-like protein [Hamadaea sp.]NUT05795.1 YbhB/YbcL family Raf kinase inhibitor-like protein [Hamadaea sp.]
MPAIQLMSPAFQDEEQLPNRFSRRGGNLSPPLEWTGVPQDTEELLLLCEDADADEFVHLLVTGIPPSVSHVAEGQLPPGGRVWSNGFGDTGWSGPQPPGGDSPHRYVFRLYALSEPPNLPQAPSGGDVRRAVEGHEIAAQTLTGLYAD